MTPAELVNLFANVPAFEPRALTVLRQMRQETGQLVPVIDSRIERARIFYEMRDLRNAATRLADALEKLPPQPVRHGSPHLMALRYECRT
jgi:hypothetical protein